MFLTNKVHSRLSEFEISSSSITDFKSIRKGLEPLDYMPKGWKNGYSKGICVNKKERVVIYWLIIW